MFVSRGSFRQFLACLPVVCHRILVGLGWGWTAPTLLKLRSPDSALPITDEQASWMASIGEMGRFCGPLIAPLILDNVGRKYTVLLAATSFLLLWPTVFFLRRINFILVSRFVFGATDGIFDVASSIYITENCSARVREIVGCMMFIIFFASYLVELVLATYLTYDNTIVVNAAISVCAYVTLCLCIETPSFLIMKNRYTEAEKNLRWLQTGLTDHQLKGELEKLKTTVQEEKEKRKSWKTLLTSRANARSLCLVLSMYIIVTATGNSAISPHVTLIFLATETFTSNHFAILYGLGNFITACVTPFVVSRINRRTLLMVCFSATTLCHACMVVVLYSRSNGYDTALHPWLVYATMAMFGSIRTMYVPALFILRGELLPLSVRAIGGTSATIVSSITGFCTARIFLPVASYSSMEMNFLIYGTMSTLMTFMVYKFLPETRGKSLDEIQMELKAGSQVGDGKNRKIEVNKA